MQEVPANETGPVPVEPMVAERRFFGVPPSTALLVLGVAALGISIGLFVTGRWPWGLIALGARHLPAHWLLYAGAAASR